MSSKQRPGRANFGASTIAWRILAPRQFQLKKQLMDKEQQALFVESWKPELRAVYQQQDAACKARQPFEGKDSYWEWVKTFAIKGGARQKGWLDNTARILDKVDDQVIRNALERRLVELGKHIIGELAKDNKCRRIRTSPMANPFERGKPSLAALAEQLLKAMKEDSGDGRAIEMALEEIEQEVSRVLAPTARGGF